MSSGRVRVRFAPSPTGYLHVGGARTALFNYLYAKKNQGDFILRIEDTDQARSTEESLIMVMEDLTWLGLKWAEGPHPVTAQDMGPHAPYRQSQRLSIYKKVADQIIQSGKAYYCFMTDAEIETQRESLKSRGLQTHVESPYVDWPLEKSLAEIKAGKKAVVRFKTQHLKKDYILKDLIRGDVKFPSDMVGDFVLLRSDGMPVYNFCCAVDDHEMQISHVLRAEEHLPNTLRQMMIYEAMNWTLPQFGHMSLILDEDRQKLSKRKGATSCHEFKKEGYLPQALNNFNALLGWSHPEGKEIMTVQEMGEHFDLARVNPAGAVFDAVKLKWMNAQYLRALPLNELWEKTEPFLNEAGLLDLPKDQAWKEKSLGLFKGYMETLADAVELYRPISDKHFEVKAEAAEALSWEPTKKVLEVWKAGLSQMNTDYLTEEQFNSLQEKVKVEAAVKGKNLFMPIRVAVIGQPHGAELKILIPLMHRQSLLKRADQVLAQIK